MTLSMTVSQPLNFDKQALTSFNLSKQESDL